MKLIRITLINLVLVVLIAIAVMIYSNNTINNYRSTAVSAIENNARGMQEVAYTYMLGEQNICDSWASYINASGMTMEEATAFVRASCREEKISAHLVWTDTYQGLSTVPVAGTEDQYTVVYQDNVSSAASEYTYSNLTALLKLDFSVEPIHITISYTNPMDGSRVIAFASELSLLDEGAPRDAILLRVVPMSYLKKNWSFVTDYPDSAVALVEPSGAFIIQPTVMKNNNFFEFIYSYNKGTIDTDALQTTMKSQRSGSFFANNAKGENTFFAYAGVDSADGWMVVLTMPESSVYQNQPQTELAWSILIALAVILCIDLWYFTIMSHKDREAHKVMQQQMETITRQHDDLEVALARAQQANNAKTTFLNNMSHDMRTPMNAIIGFTNLATRHIDDREQTLEDLKKIELSGNQLLALINDVLDMSRIESGRITLQEDEEDLVDLVTELRTIIQPTIDEKQLKLTVETGSITHTGVVCDKLRLSQIMLNLLSNAMKFTPAGGTVSAIVNELPGAPEGSADYELKVRDTGIGISAEFLPHVFESFTRERSSTVSGIQGTGLGLAITKHIVELMGGTITVESTQGKGTEFTVRLRLKTCEKAPEAVPATLPERAPDESFADKKLLLVEDNELNREIALDILEEEGFTVDTACDGTEAVEKLRDARPGRYDLVLMDIQMPKMDGYEATRQIRQLPDPVLRSIPILAMTANAFEEDKQKALAAGMNGHVAKPIDIPVLLEAIRQALK